MGAGINKAIKRRNEQLERDIANIRKFYDDFTQKSDAFILELTNERDEANENLDFAKNTHEYMKQELGKERGKVKALINRNWWQRLTRKLEEPKTKGIFNSLNNGNGIQMGKEINI